MFKGTKGKWGDMSGSNYSIDIILPNDSEITISRYNRYSDRLAMDRAEMEYNALLISKAPEMLEMLQKAYEFIDDSGVQSGANDILNKIDQLIKEATDL